MRKADIIVLFSQCLKMRYLYAILHADVITGINYIKIRIGGDYKNNVVSDQAVTRKFSDQSND